MSTLREAFLNELRDIYDAEKQLVKALPKLAKAATRQELKEAVEDHLGETEGHVDRLVQVFEMLDEQPRAKSCKAMQGLIAEGEECIKQHTGDAALICAFQKVEHYEIASYGSLCAWAKVMGEEDAAETLNETLEDEKSADRKLSELAESTINAEEEEFEHAGGRSSK